MFDLGFFSLKQSTSNLLSEKVCNTNFCSKSRVWIPYSGLRMGRGESRKYENHSLGSIQLEMPFVDPRASFQGLVFIRLLCG